MNISCPICEKEFEVTWGDEESEMICDCGTTLVVKYDEFYDEESNDEYNYWWLEERK